MEVNTNSRRINQEVIDILTKPVEPAFEGTALEGKRRRYTVINHKDLDKYVDAFTQNELSIALDHVLGRIEDGRESEGKKPFNSYIVINTDEPYIDEIIEVMKRHGHFE